MCNRVAQVMWEKYDEQQQLEVLSKTAIFVTNQGSSAFRLFYLPDGAQIVYIGALEADKTRVSELKAFNNFYKCFKDFTHLTWHKYHVRYGDVAKKRPYAVPWEYTAYNKDVVAKEGRVAALLQAAVSNLKRTVDAMTQVQ